MGWDGERGGEDERKASIWEANVMEKTTSENTWSARA